MLAWRRLRSILGITLLGAALLSILHATGTLDLSFSPAGVEVLTTAPPAPEVSDIVDTTQPWTTSAPAHEGQTTRVSPGFNFTHAALHPKVFADGLFEPGDPSVTHVPPFGTPPTPTATPPPGVELTEEDEFWYNPIIPLVHMSSMRRLGDCALVGSHGALKGRGLGSRIDSHQVVIRVNDVYSFDDDVGYKTDIFFSTMCKVMFRKHALGTQGLKDGPSCNYYCLSRPPLPECPFRAYIIAGLNASECSTSINSRGYEGMQYIERKACFPTGYVNDFWSTDIQTLRRQKREYMGRPTTGFHAIVVFGYICDSLTMYGVGLSVAGHRMQKVHAPEKERDLLHKIVNGTLPVEEYPPILRTTLRRKAMNHSLKFAFTS